MFLANMFKVNINKKEGIYFISITYFKIECKVVYGTVCFFVQFNNSS